MRGECRRANVWLQLYVDGRLDPRRLPALEQHLDACAECRAALSAYEVVAQSAGMPEGAPEPAQLTALILARIAAYEAQKQSHGQTVAAQRRQFALRWADALLAAMLATVSTLLFALLNPGVREAMAHTFPLAATMLGAPGPGAIAWSAWIVWIASGTGLTLVLAGGEVRTAWRKRLIARLGQWQRPQWPTLRGI